MRTALALALPAALGACAAGPAAGDDTHTPDAGPPPGPGFTLVSAPFTIPPGLDATLCWYFRTPNTEPLAVKRFTSKMSPGSHHLIMYTTDVDLQPPGAINAVDCEANGLASRWTYGAEEPEGELRMPDDDGEGKPIALELPPNQAGFLQMHYYNTSDQPLTIGATLEVEGLEPGVAYTKTAPYVTYNSKILIPPNTVSPPDLEAQTCDVSKTAKFWQLSTHAHERAVATRVRDGQPTTGAMVFESTDWDNPIPKRWDRAPFHTFSTGQLTYECEYVNTSPFPIETGQAARNYEMCMASGYFFPATQGVFCYDGIEF